MKQIYVCTSGKVEDHPFFNTIGEFSLLPSFYCVRKGIEKNINNIVTYDASVFGFSKLKKDYDVTLINEDGYIRLSELLDNNHNYTTKFMRKEHNVFRMFVANAFNWQKFDNLK